MRIYPNPIDNEIILSPKKVIMSKTNHKGVIEFVNDYFAEVCQYSNKELVGKPHNIIRHPDMPKIIFKIMWQKLHKGENVYAIVKNLTKDGSFYWVVTKFETTFDNEGNIVAYYARRKAVPKRVKETAESIYERILAIEKHDVKMAEDTFYKVLKDYNLTYDQLFLEIVDMNEIEVEDYFLSSKFNTNTSIENIILEIDGEKENFNTKTNELNSTSLIKNNGFLGSLSDQLKKELKLLQKK